MNYEPLSLVKRELSNNNIASRIVPFYRWDEAREETSHLMANTLDPRIIEYIESCFQFEIERDLSEPRSILISDVLNPKVCFHFTRVSKEIEAICTDCSARAMLMNSSAWSPPSPCPSPGSR